MLFARRPKTLIETIKVGIFIYLKIFTFDEYTTLPYQPVSTLICSAHMPFQGTYTRDTNRHTRDINIHTQACTQQIIELRTFKQEARRSNRQQESAYTRSTSHLHEPSTKYVTKCKKENASELKSIIYQKRIGHYEKMSMVCFQWQDSHFVVVVFCTFTFTVIDNRGARVTIFGVNPKNKKIVLWLI